MMRNFLFRSRWLPRLVPVFVFCLWPVSGPGGQGSAVQAASKADISGREILGRMDRFLRLPNGLLRGKMTIIHRSGRTRTFKLNLYKNDENALYIFESRRRGLEKKILYNESGEVIWELDAQSKKLFQKRNQEIYSSALGSGFAFIDLAMQSLQANYDAKVTGKAKFEGRTYMKLELKPLRPGRYKKLVALVDDRKRYRPVRFDFMGQHGVLIKSMTMQYSRLPVRTSKRRVRRRLNSRRDLIDPKSGTISILEIFTGDKTVQPDKSIYRNENLSR